jgi:hypothetical protein
MNTHLPGFQRMTSNDFGNALYQNGVGGQSVDMAAHADTNFGTGEFTIAGWWYIPAAQVTALNVSTNYNLIMKRVDNSNLMGLRFRKINTSDTWVNPILTVIIGGVTHINSSINGVWQRMYQNKWNFVAVGRRSDNTTFVSLNGYVQATATVTANVTLSSTWKMGGAVQTTLGANSEKYVDDIMFFNRGLTDTEIKSLWGGGNGSNAKGMSGLIRYFRLNEPAGTASQVGGVAKDETGAQDATFVNYASGNKDFVNHTSLL